MNIRLGEPTIWFAKSGGVVFSATGVAKIVSVFGKAKLLDYHDPITDFSFRHLMILAAIVEIAVGLFCLLSDRSVLGTKLIAWLATVLIGYRFGLWLVDWKSPCLCLGALTDAIRISPEVADTVMKAILVYFVVGSYLILICNPRARSRAGVHNASNK